MVMTIGWNDGAVMMLDQRLLPQETKFLTLNSLPQVIQGIKEMAIRGAPAIGCAAAMGLALGSAQIEAKVYSSSLCGAT